MENRVCYIVGSGLFDGKMFRPRPNDYIIAADGGYAYLDRMSIIPDAVVGDFDSLGYVPKHPNIIKHPIEKDDTDTMLAIKYAMNIGFNNFYIFGCLGGRVDHSIATIQTLCYISNHGGHGYIFGGNSVITALTSGEMSFDEGRYGTVSVFCQGPRAEGVTIKGLKYPLDNANLTYDTPLGVSNEFIGTSATISIKKGTIIIVFSEDNFKDEFKNEKEEI